MDFFEYANIANAFVNAETWYIPFIVGGLCFLVVFVFQAVGLFVIAGREGYKNRWMAFVPFCNTYFIGVCGQKNRVFKSIDTKILALVAAVLEALLVAGFILLYTAQLKLSQAGCVYSMVDDSLYGQESYFLKNIPGDLAWAAWCFTYLYDYILVWANLIFLMVMVFVYSAFFQTFAARRYVIFTITSILFPVQGILIFILRNNRGMNYREFLMQEQARQYRMYQNYYRQNGNPYNYNPYSNGGYSTPDMNGGTYNQPPYGSYQNTPPAEDPFAEFGNNNSSDKKDDDPFS